ncbi:tellurite resistance/C4-dicarboxylate transporter family protein [Methylobacter sp. Wu1]|uniref:tellurite resistance/C4-dicarboxylate transporter family protein n=1 Tax=Methylobacter sp. Wu1 TaxID=3119359 RepID=UPI002F93B2D9
MVKAGRLIAQCIKELFPGYFALVMATGIVSISAHLQEEQAVAGLLFLLNQAAYIALSVLSLARCIVYPSRAIADLTNPALAPAFLTTVAGTDILGVQFALFDQNYEMGFALWITGFFLWIVLIYGMLTALVIRESALNLTVMNGSWLMVAVATQSVAVLAMMLAPWLAARQEVLVFSSLTLYLLGCVLYFLIILLIIYRLILLPLEPEEFVPSYWINMGAAAITTLAGATPILHSSNIPWLQNIIPFLKGMTLLSWAFGTWWIPFIIILSFWRYVYKGFPIAYDAGYWSMVFPLGMYSTCTYEMAAAMEISILRPVHWFFYCASLSAWIVVLAGFIRRIAATMAREFLTVLIVLNLL